MSEYVPLCTNTGIRHQSVLYNFFLYITCILPILKIYITTHTIKYQYYFYRLPNSRDSSKKFTPMTPHPIKEFLSRHEVFMGPLFVNKSVIQDWGTTHKTDIILRQVDGSIFHYFQKIDYKDDIL